MRVCWCLPSVTSKKGRGSGRDLRDGGRGLAVQGFSDEDVLEGLFSIDTVSCSNTFNSFWTKSSYVNPQR